MIPAVAVQVKNIKNVVGNNNMIVFNKNQYTPVKYTEAMDKFLVAGQFIQFLSGSKRKIIRISHIDEKGVIWGANIENNFNHAVSKQSIIKVFVDRIKGKLKNNYLKVMEKTNDGTIGYLDGALDRVITIIRKKHEDILIDDKKIDKLKNFTRKVKFSFGDSNITLAISKEDNNKMTIDSSLSDRSSSIKYNDGKLNIDLLVDKVISLKNQQLMMRYQ